MTDAPHPSYLEGHRLMRRATNAPVRAVLAHWIGLHDRERLPDRTSFDPLDLPSRVLPYLFLLERSSDERWRLRLMGSHLVAALGHDFTGRELVDEQIPDISRSRTVRLLDQVVGNGLPGHFHGRSGFRFRDHYDDHEQILLPFRRHEADEVGVALGAIVYEGLRQVFGPGISW